MQALVLTLDQRHSRAQADRVPELLTALATVPTRLGFERTAGDEVQALLDAPAALAPAVEAALRLGGWRIGVGVGSVDEPLPSDTRAARGAAYVAAREAVEAARTSPADLSVRTVAPEGDDGPDDQAVRALESALWLWAALLQRRTERGWAVVDLVDQGLSYEQAGRRLGISQSAVSQRAQAAGLAEGRRARELVTHLAVGILGQDPRP